jgi:hypothetical protein
MPVMTESQVARDCRRVEAYVEPEAHASLKALANNHRNIGVALDYVVSTLTVDGFKEFYKGVERGSKMKVDCFVDPTTDKFFRECREEFGHRASKTAIVEALMLYLEDHKEK